MFVCVLSFFGLVVFEEPKCVDLCHFALHAIVVVSIHFSDFSAFFQPKNHTIHFFCTASDIDEVFGHRRDSHVLSAAFENDGL